MDECEREAETSERGSGRGSGGGGGGGGACWLSFVSTDSELFVPSNSNFDFDSDFDCDCEGDWEGERDWAFMLEEWEGLIVFSTVSEIEGCTYVFSRNTFSLLFWTPICNSWNNKWRKTI